MIRFVCVRSLFTVLALGLGALTAGLAQANPPNLLPTPKSVQLSGGEMRLSAESRIVAVDPSLVPLAAIVSDEIRMITNLKLASAQGTGRPGDIVLKIDPQLRAGAEIVAVQKKDGKQQVVRTRDFAHTIAVGDMAVVTGWDYRAVGEGTATILQSLTEEKGTWLLPRMQIKDWPHADYTGTMIDCGRQWIPPDTIKFTIEACRFWKIRYVQIHFSDDHAYTFGSKAFPQLGKHNRPISKGAVARCYTWEEMQDLEAYAVARGVTIVPELETPGHSGAMARDLPAIFKGPGCMPMASEKLYEALDTLVGEMCSIFNASPYFHIGCDEASTGAVGRKPAEKEYMKLHTIPGDNHPLNDAWQVYIMHMIRMKQICAKYGKIPIAWEGFPADKRIKDDMIVMTWYSQGIAREMEAQGWNVITVPWFTGPISKWNIYYANDHIYQRTTNVLGAQRPMWQMSDIALLEGYVPGLCERQERTWGPDNEWGDEAAYRQRMAKSTERMFQVAAPVKVLVEGEKILGVAEGLRGWVDFTDTVTVKLAVPRLPEGGTIHYTLDGTEPTPQSPAYAGPLTMDQSFRLNAAISLDGRMVGSSTRVRYVWKDLSGWITEYQMAAPYMKDNRPGMQLFDVPFEPETGGKVEWKLWKGSGLDPWVCRLSPLGDNRCGYLRTKIWSPKDQDVRLLLKSDDGAKVWLNGTVAHRDTKGQVFSFPAQKVAVSLKSGWNELLLKVVQDGFGWGASVRVVAADGTKLEELKFKAE